MEYDTDFKDWDMNCIKQVEKIYSEISRDI